jgi:hypothetical protein
MQEDAVELPYSGSWDFMESDVYLQERPSQLRMAPPSSFFRQVSPEQCQSRSGDDVEARQRPFQNVCSTFLETPSHVVSEGCLPCGLYWYCPYLPVAVM